MYRLLLILILAAAFTLSACTSSGEVAHNPSTAESTDCDGTKGICLVSDHDEKQPLTTDLLNQKFHDYLFNHPTEIAQIVSQAQSAANQQKAADSLARLRKGIADNHDAIFADSSDPILGNPQGDITIVEYFDNECPYCKKLAPEIDKLLTIDHNVRVVMKEFPILDAPGVAMSTLSAKYALAANLQHKYPEFHHALMASTIQEHQLSEDNLKAFAKSAGLNLTRLAVDIKRPEIAQQIATNRNIGGQIGIGSTPTLIVADLPHSTMITAENLAREIEAIRQKRKNEAKSKTSS